MNLTGFVNGMEKAAAASIKAEQGDYLGDDGLLYCGKCQTKKQTRIMILGEERTPMCLCKCAAEKREAEEEERRRIEFQRKIAEYRRAAFPESNMQDWTFANDDGTNEKIIGAMRRYADNFDDLMKQGKGLLLFGTVGTGKTYAAACIANALLDRGYPVMMTNFTRIANTAQGMFEGRQAYFDSFNRFPLLILDDLKTERSTEYMQEIVYNVIDSRYRAGLPLIVTTNLTSEELKHPSEISYQRIFSRLLEMCLPVEVAGKDRRLERLKADIQPMKNLLGL